MKNTDKTLNTTNPDLFSVKTIGYVKSDYVQTKDVSHTHNGWTADISQINLLPKYAGGLGGLKGYSHIIVLFLVHRAKEWKMPKNNRKPPHVKVFATRMPVRPNSIGMSVVELLDFSTDTGRITVKGLDALNGTPVLDIKPYIPNFDSYPEASVPKWVRKHLHSHFHNGNRDNSHHHNHTDNPE